MCLLRFQKNLSSIFFQRFLAGGKIILAGGKIIDNGTIFSFGPPPPPFVGLLVNVGKLFWQVEKLSIIECEELILSQTHPDQTLPDDQTIPSSLSA